MSCTLPVLNISPQECIGDSLGKINYNMLVLDTTLCNLSSEMYLPDTGFKSIYQDINSFIYNYGDIYNYINEDSTNQILQAASTVTLLSSFWGTNEFSISLPINAVSLNENDTILISPVLSTINESTLNSLVETFLKNLCLVELDTNYSAYQYPNNTIVNISTLLYNINPSLSSVDVAYTQDPLVKVSYSPSNVFSYNNRVITANYNRDNIFVTSGLILRFFVQDSKWNYMGFIHDENDSIAESNEKIQSVFGTPLVVNNTINNQASFLKPCNPILADTWYSCGTYSFASGLYSGTSGKLGSVTLTLRTPTNKTSVFTQTAQGYNPLTNTGGTDVYLEYDGDVINAYEQYPTPKTLVKSWPNPYVGLTNINFKYTYDNKGVTFNLCASEGYFSQ